MVVVKKASVLFDIFYVYQRYVKLLIISKYRTKKRERAQLMLADGFTREQASKYSGVPLDEL